MNIGDEFKADILKDGEVILSDYPVKIWDAPEPFTTLGKQGYLFHVFAKNEKELPISDGDKCQLVSEQGNYDLLVDRASQPASYIWSITFIVLD